jgi:hypothetical protein
MHLPPEVDSATCLLVIQGFGYDPGHRDRSVVLHREDDPTAIRAALAVLAGGPEPDELTAHMEVPSVSVVLLRDDTLLTEVGVLRDASWLRRPHGGDVPVADPDALRAWLTGVGASL